MCLVQEQLGLLIEHCSRSGLCFCRLQMHLYWEKQHYACLYQHMIAGSESAQSITFTFRRYAEESLKTKRTIHLELPSDWCISPPLCNATKSPSNYCLQKEQQQTLPRDWTPWFLCIPSNSGHSMQWQNKLPLFSKQLSLTASAHTPSSVTHKELVSKPQKMERLNTLAQKLVEEIATDLPGKPASIEPGPNAGREVLKCN